MAKFLFKNKEIYYEEHGQGKPLLVLNGIMMSTASWTEFVEPFSANNHLILVDFLDQGQSDRYPDEPYDHDIQVDVAKAVLDHVGVKEACVMGISYGGEIAMELALKYPECVERLILFNTTPRTGPWLGDIGNAWNMATGDPDAYYLTTIPVIYSPKFYREKNDWLQRRREVLRPVFASDHFIKAMIRLTDSSLNYDIVDRLHEIKVPTLVVSSREDYLTPLEEQELICSKIPNSHHVIIPGSGHASMYEAPLLYTALTLGFCNNTKTTFNIV